MGTPTGAVDFSGNGTVALGSATLDSTSGQATANLNVPGYLFVNAGTYSLTAQYRGDAVFSAGGATANVQIAAPIGVSSIVPAVPVSVTATADPAGPFWEFTITLRERGGVAAVLTDVNLDGQDQPVAQFFDSASIPANGSIASGHVIFRDLAYPLVRTFIFSGVDATGLSWSRQVGIAFLGLQVAVQPPTVTAIPLVVPQDPAAAANCQWSQQVVVTEFSGYAQTIASLSLGSAPIGVLIPAIFGTAQLAPYGSLQGGICWPGAAAGETSQLTIHFASGLSQTLAVSFAGPVENPPSVSVSVPALNLSTASPQAIWAIVVPDGQSWTIGVNPQNILSGWLSLSQSTGTGSAQIIVTASGTGFAPGAYFANLVIQGPNFWPPSVTVPVTFVNGDSTGVTIGSLTNAASGQSVAAPGMLAVLQGANLYRGGINVSNAFGPVYSYASNAAVPIGITVNGVPAALTNVTPSQIKFQIPYEIGAGTAVVGVGYSGKVGAFVFQVSPSAPGIYADATGSVGTVQAGKSISLTMTGGGVTNPALGDATAGTSSLVYKTALPITLTIGGVPASITSYGIAADSYSTTLNVAIPASASVGIQPVVVTVGGVSSPPVNITIAPAQ